MSPLAGRELQEDREIPIQVWVCLILIVFVLVAMVAIVVMACCVYRACSRRIRLCEIACDAKQYPQQYPDSQKYPYPKPQQYYQPSSYATGRDYSTQQYPGEYPTQEYPNDSGPAGDDFFDSTKMRALKEEARLEWFSWAVEAGANRGEDRSLYSDEHSGDDVFCCSEYAALHETVVTDVGVFTPSRVCVPAPSCLRLATAPDVDFQHTVGWERRPGSQALRERGRAAPRRGDRGCSRRARGRAGGVASAGTRPFRAGA